MSYATSSYVICHIILCHMPRHLMSFVTSSYVAGVICWRHLLRASAHALNAVCPCRQLHLCKCVGRVHRAASSVLPIYTRVKRGLYYYSILPISMSWCVVEVTQGIHLPARDACAHGALNRWRKRRRRRRQRATRRKCSATSSALAPSYRLPRRWISRSCRPFPSRRRPLRSGV